jgi:hypothetical protein
MTTHPPSPGSGQSPRSGPGAGLRGLRVRSLAGLAALLLILGCTPVPPTPSPTPSPTLTPTRPPVAIGPVIVTGIGDLAQGAASANGLVLMFSEVSPAAIGVGPGSLWVILTDQAGRAGSVTFTGTPSIAAPGSLGASATLSAPNVLTINVLDSDPLNVEPMTVTGLGISATSIAAVGPINASIAGCTGSLAGCTATSVLPSPGNIIAAP